MSTPEDKPVGKGRPTPKRSEAQRRRTGPVAPPPQTRKEAAARTKEQAAAAKALRKEGGGPRRAAATAGDERDVAPRDAGPVRALVRDIIDARRNIGVLLLPLALLLVLAQLSGNRRVLDLALTVWLAGVLALFGDIILITVSIRRKVRAQHPGQGKLRNHVAYGLLRSTVFRRMRLPATRVSPGRARPA